MRAHFLQHVPFEPPGLLLVWAIEKGCAITFTRFHENGWSLPDTKDVDIIFIMGGPMGVYDELPWLVEEKEWIRSVMDAGKRLMGTCLGAQLLAEVMGGKVYPHEHKEIGWWPISWSDEAVKHPLFRHFPRNHDVLHWHGDTFDLPEGALLMASSEACDHQAFISSDNNVIGFQFHMEVDAGMVRTFAENDPKAFRQDGLWVQEADEILMERHSTMMANRQLLRSMLDKWVD